jgi:ascorbate PTS system EIIB component
MMSRGRPDPLKVLTVCGDGMGSSLMLRLSVEEVLADLGVAAKVEATDVSSARGMAADVIVGQGLHTAEFEGQAPIVVTITNFMDKDGLQRQLDEALREEGWLA